jgi:thiol-disulfide isomerase/thioredoxin
VGAVAHGSPAAAAGVLPGDTLLVVNGHNLIDLDPISPARALDLLRRGPAGEGRLVLGRGTGTLGVSLPLAPRSDAASPDPPRLGGVAPLFSARGLENEEVALAELRGTPVLIEFWASWCAPCRSSAITLRRLADEHAGRLAIIGVSLDEDRRDYEAFVHNNRLPGPQIFDGGWHGPVARLYGVAGIGIPYSVLIDREGRIAALGGSLQDQEAEIGRLAAVPGKP